MDQFALYSHFRAFYKQFLCQAGQLAPGHYLMPLVSVTRSPLAFCRDSLVARLILASFLSFPHFNDLRVCTQVADQLNFVSHCTHNIFDLSVLHFNTSLNCLFET